MGDARWFRHAATLVVLVGIGCHKPKPRRSRADRTADVARSLRLPISKVQRVVADTGYEPEAIAALPTPQRYQIFARSTHPDDPAAAAEFRLAQLRVGGRISPRALQSLSVKIARPKTRTRIDETEYLQAIQFGAPDETGWISLGPSAVGGRTRALVFDPSKPSRLWVASTAGGIWRNDDVENAGAFWHLDSANLSNLAVTSLAITPDGKDLFAGTGEFFADEIGFDGGGIFWLHDGIWNPLVNTAIDDFKFINRLALSPDGKTLFAGTWHGLFRSTAPFADWTPGPSDPTFDVQFAPGSSRSLIASGLGGAIFWSDDGGDHWTYAAGIAIDQPDGGVLSLPLDDNGRVSIAYAAGDAQRVYAAVNRDGGQLWRSDDGGKSFAPITATDADGGVIRLLDDGGFHADAVWAGDPSNRDLVLVGGVDVWRSHDAGATFSRVSEWWRSPDSAHADQHQFALGPSRSVYVANDGGVFRASGMLDAQPPSWQARDAGYGVTQFYRASIQSDPGKPGAYLLLAGAQDNGLQLYRSSDQSWTLLATGDGGYTLPMPKKPGLFYGETQEGALIRTRSLNPFDVVEIDGFIPDPQDASKMIPRPDATRVLTEANSKGCGWIAPFVVDPNNEHTMLIGCSALWISDNIDEDVDATHGPIWRRLLAVTPHGVISALLLLPAGRILVGYSDGTIVSTMIAPGTAQAAPVTSPSLPRDRSVLLLASDPNNPARLFAGFGGLSESQQLANLYESKNGGKSWNNISGKLGGALPPVPVRAVAVHPKHPDALYVGTEWGVYHRERPDGAWQPIDEGPTGCSVEQLILNGDGSLFAVTHARGIYQLRLPQ